MLEVFTCPDDPQNSNRPGGLSYVVNAGYTDGGPGVNTYRPENVDGLELNDDLLISREEAQIARATGVFWNRTFSGFRMKLERIGQGDGLSQTLMLAENSRKPRDWGKQDLDTQWRTYESAEHLAFAMGVGHPDPDPDAGPIEVRGILAMGVPGEPLRLLPKSDSAAPRWLWGTSLTKVVNIPGHPKSEHSGGLHFSFCDGRVKFISVNIDESIYARLMTSDGGRFGQIAFGSEGF